VTIILVVINVIVFFFARFLVRDQAGATIFGDIFILTPKLVAEKGFFWQLITYMFMHGNETHIFFNMFSLLMFGVQLEKGMGSKEFLLYYLVVGILVGLSSFLFGYNDSLIGASGAIYGVMLAFAVLFPNAEILLFFAVRMKVPMAVLLFTGVSIILMVLDTTSGISHVGHLSGIVFGILYFIVRFGINPVKVFIDNLKRR
jgi:membrane associated rhomboid family serine protease